MSVTTKQLFSPVARGRLPLPAWVKVTGCGMTLVATVSAATWFFVIPHKPAAPPIPSAHWDVGRPLKAELPKPDAFPAAPAPSPPPAPANKVADTPAPTAPPAAPPRLMRVWGADGSNTPTNSRQAGLGLRSGPPNANGRSGGPDVPDDAPQPPGNPEYAQMLTPTKSRTTEASVYTDYSLLLKAGTDIECISNSPLDNQLAGDIGCTVQREVWSADGSNILIDRLATANGTITRGLGEGQDRAFILWQTIDSDHVTADLNSPGADQLGQNGVPGIIDEHWWPRIRSALALTGIDTASGVLQNLASKQGSTSINFSQGQSLASTAAQQNMNIPRTLWVGQAKTLMIHIQHNIPFHRAYGNRMVAGR